MPNKKIPPKAPRRRASSNNIAVQDEANFVFGVVKNNGDENKKPTGPVRELVEHFDYPWQDESCKGRKEFNFRVEAKLFAASKWLINEKNLNSPHCRKTQNGLFNELIKKAILSSLSEMGIPESDIEEI